jgi:hypothetical protein
MYLFLYTETLLIKYIKSYLTFIYSIVNVTVGRCDLNSFNDIGDETSGHTGKHNTIIVRSFIHFLAKLIKIQGIVVYGYRPISIIKDAIVDAHSVKTTNRRLQDVSRH